MPTMTHYERANLLLQDAFNSSKDVGDDKPDHYSSTAAITCALGAVACAILHLATVIKQRD